MIEAVVVVSLSLAIANWLLFVAASVLANWSRIRAALRGMPEPEPSSDASFERRAATGEVLKATGGLATALRSAGPGAAAAALSLACLLVAAVAAGVGKL